MIIRGKGSLYSKKMDALIQTVLKRYPQTQAVYLFGSYDTEDEWPKSDADIALLLPVKKAKNTGSLLMSDLQFEIEALLKKEVDLINLRLVSTVFQKEIIAANRRIFCADNNDADIFEMLVLSNYQKLNEERSGIIGDALKTGRFYNL